jgi:hypothetical protein
MDTIMRLKHVIYWPNFLTRKIRRKFLVFLFLQFFPQSQYSSVRIMIRLWAGKLGFDSQQRKGFSPGHCIQISSVAHPASCTMGSRDSFPKGEVAREQS